MTMFQLPRPEPLPLELLVRQAPLPLELLVRQAPPVHQVLEPLVTPE